jgi:hypothetical protein
MRTGRAIRTAVVFAAAFIALSCPVAAAAEAGKADGSEPSPQVLKSTSPEAQALIGRWVRTDAYYLIEVRPSEEGNSLMVGYFNPRPINVGRAEFTDSIAGPVLTVELQDTNYPGSTYILTYERARDVLIGTYFQAVQGTTFDVAFIRQM